MCLLVLTMTVTLLIFGTCIDSCCFVRQMSQVGLTETVKGDPKKFEVWLPGRSEVYTILATSVDDRETWVRLLGRLVCYFAHVKSISARTTVTPCNIIIMS